MSNVLRRAEIVNALTAAGVQFDPEATVADLRPLFDALLQERVVNPAGVVEQQLPVAEPPPQQPQQPQLLQEQPEEADRIARMDQLAAEEAEVDRQLAIMRKKQELSELQRAFQVNEHRRFDFVAFEAMITPFTGDDSYDVHKWFQDLEDAFEAFRCGERDKFIATRRSIQGTARVFVRGIRVGTYRELKTALLDEFQHAYGMHEVYQQMKERTLKPDESLKHYVAVMIELANRANIPEVDVIILLLN